MSGLSLTLRPREKFLIGGHLVENGPRRSSIRISGEDVYVLRLSDALHPDDVTTPVRRAYYTAQLILACSLPTEEGVRQLNDQLAELFPIFARVGQSEAMGKIVETVEVRRFYATLVGLKALFAIEDELLGHASSASIVDSIANQDAASRAVVNGR